MYSFGILMDPIDQIDINKDSTIAIAKALQNKCEVHYIIPDTLHINNSKVYGKTAELKINKSKKPFYEINNVRLKELSFLNCILFRLDPPVDEHYIQVTHILDLMESQGVLVINSPQSIRDFNEKMLGSKLTKKLIPTLVSSNKAFIDKFIKKYKKVVVKPINMMAGKGIISLTHGNKDNHDLLNEMLSGSKKYVICQKFITDIKKGDTRILVANGKVYEDVLVRYPPKNDFRSNLSYGGKYKVKKINPKHLDYLNEVAIYLKYNRIYFAGIDMIGDYITEINITSPTGIKQIEEKNKRISNDIASQFINIIKSHYE